MTVEVEVDETTVETAEVTMTVEVDQVTEVEDVLINEDMGVQDQEVGEAVISVTQVVYEEVVEGNEIKRTFLYSVISLVTQSLT